MYNFTIGFEHPWLLLLLIPALALTLIPYFRSSKKYRRNRNRIVSMTLHMLVMTLCICVLSGIVFRYDVPNTENQVVLLVDMSDSGEQAEASRDGIVSDILGESRAQCSVGVVLFGYDQVLASPLSADTEEVYRRYASAPLPDTTATDFEGALRYARTLITNPGTAKIVVVSDGLETDGEGHSYVRSVAADGIRVDTVAVTRPDLPEVEITGIGTPESNVVVGAEVTVTVSLEASVGTADAPVEAVCSIYDNGEEKRSGSVWLTGSSVQFTVSDYTFDTPGLHRLSASVQTADDTLAENNTFHTYVELAVFDRVLVFERNSGEASQVREILTEDTGYTVDVVNLLTQPEKVPTSVNALREYDEVVLVNIADADMPEGLDELLNSYVYTYGGGLFTVGGNNEDGEANAYVREDMEGTLYQQMLPVQAINYTPPLGVIFLLDVSGSMFDGAVASGKSYIELAKEAVASCVQFSLSERDYCGIIALGDPAVEISPVLPVPRMSTIIAAMENIRISETGTPYASSIRAAYSALGALTRVEKRHVVIISDGDPTDDKEEYTAAAEECAEVGVTLTIVNIGSSSQNDETLSDVAAKGNGRYIKISDIRELTNKMRNELEADEIKAYNPERFTPTIREHTVAVNGITQDDVPALDGFYGTKIKEDATSVLVGEYVPVYAQWKYGEGSVGSFMCDLNGTWSAEFIADGSPGRQIVRNIVLALFPTHDIRPSEIEVSLSSKNYLTAMSIYTDLDETERIAAYRIGEDGTRTDIAMDPDNGYTRTEFVITQPGVHEIVVEKLDAEGNVLAQASVRRAFSYSEEYNVLTEQDGQAYLAQLASAGKGKAVTETWQIFDGFERAIHMTYDPRLALCIAALALFLLDIAVRKFKFKWLHEIIREHAEKRAERAGKAKGGSGA